VRYADDIVCGFEHEREARAFQSALRGRMGTYGLELHAEKTRLIEFGRFAAVNRKSRGKQKPETFTFLGFTHICGHTQRGRFVLQRKSRRDRMRSKLKEIKEQLRCHMHADIPEQGRWLGNVVRGYFTYHAVPMNNLALKAFRNAVIDAWQRVLKHRGQRDRTNWVVMRRLAKQWLPMPRILHPWPDVRFAVKHPR
jgi:RNA-directed DNA polymerase